MIFTLLGLLVIVTAQGQWDLQNGQNVTVGGQLWNYQIGHCLDSD